MLWSRRPVTREVIREDFDAIAALERHQGRPLDDHELWVRQHVAPGRVLDVGCGTGALTRALAAGAAEVVGLDLSPQMIEVARQRSAGHANLRYIEGELMAWQNAEPFDCVVSVAALHHLPLSPALRKIAGLLRPGGRLLVVDLIAAWAPSEIPHSALAYLARRRSKEPTKKVDPHARAVWRRHGKHDRLLSLRQIRSVYAGALPEAMVTRQSGWRYRAMWRKP